ncbi:hypothetical protein BJ742DRAFT_274557 [Cladochytrium replicatum]|nr:hypothetical protein BJ742DRAFT_274557 [Cladochytrium replicatum]
MGPKPCADASPAVVESQNIGSALPESGGVQKPINRRNSGRTSKNAESDRPTLSKSELAQIQNIQQSAAKLAKDMGFAAPSAQQNKQQQQSAAIASAQKIDVGGPIAGKGGTNPGRNSATDQTPQSQQKSQPKSDSESVPPAPPQPAPPQPPTQNPSQHQQPQSSSHPQQHAQAQNQLKSEDLGNLIQSKIGQLETEAAHEEEEERAIGNHA